MEYFKVVFQLKLKGIHTSGSVSNLSTTGSIQAIGLLEEAILIWIPDGSSEAPEHGRTDQQSKTPDLK